MSIDQTPTILGDAIPDVAYLGILDDFAGRHRDLSVQSIEALNEHLVFEAMFGSPMLINDGHLVAHHVIREGIARPWASPLRKLIEVGHIKILTRNGGNLGELPQLMADDGIQSAQELLADRVFSRDYLPVLSDWSSRLSSPAYNSFQPWPDVNVTDIYRSVSSTALSSLTASATSDLRREMKRFRSKVDRTAGRRTEWETQATLLLNDGKIGQSAAHQLMLAANEAYQYAWGCALALSGQRIGVTTRLPQHLAILDEQLDVPLRPVNPPITIWKGNRKQATKVLGNDWDRLASLTSVGSPANVLKWEWRRALMDYQTGSVVGDERIREAAEAYGQELSQRLAKPGLLPFAFDVVSTVVSTLAGGLVAGPLGVAVGLAISFGQVAAAHTFAPRLFARITAPKPELWWDGRSPQAPEMSVSSFMLSPVQVRAHTANAARWNA